MQIQPAPDKDPFELFDIQSLFKRIFSQLPKEPRQYYTWAQTEQASFMRTTVTTTDSEGIPEWKWQLCSAVFRKALFAVVQQ